MGADKAQMRAMEQTKRRQLKLKDEYPSDLTFIGQRQRGDASDAPITVRLPMLKAKVLANENETEHNAEADNDLSVLVAFENRDNADVKEERAKKEKKEKKKAKKEKARASKKAKSADEAEDGDVEMGSEK